MTRFDIAPEAEAELAAITDYYLSVAGVEVAMTFLQAWAKWQDHVLIFPQSGSTRYETSLNLPGLRAWPVSGFPYVGFYTLQSNMLRVNRVLHMSRDIPARFRE